MVRLAASEASDKETDFNSCREVAAYKQVFKKESEAEGNLKSQHGYLLSPRD